MLLAALICIWFHPIDEIRLKQIQQDLASLRYSKKDKSFFIYLNCVILRKQASTEETTVDETQTKF